MENHEERKRTASEANLDSCCPNHKHSEKQHNTAHNNSLETVNEAEIILKRVNAIDWDDYFMAISFLSAMRSKDPSTQVGACIVNADKRIVGIGYNGFPRGCSDDILPWSRTADDELDTKYPVRKCSFNKSNSSINFVMHLSQYVCHAEVNAILNKNSSDVKGCTVCILLTAAVWLCGSCGLLFFVQIYVALFPCNECAKMIIQSGIKEVVYLSDKYKNTTSMKASRRMMNMAGVSSRSSSVLFFLIRHCVVVR